VWENLDLAGAKDKGKAEDVSLAPFPYVRFTDAWKGVPRGTIALADTVVPGYPRIGRILALQSGLHERFEGGFWTEEKVDGYNVRICRLHGHALAITRGGFVCPFTTDRLPDLIDLTLLDDEPDLVLCAEVAGPDNPYNESCPPFVTEDVRLFVFDMMRLGQGGFLPPQAVYERIERFALPSVQRFGRYTVADVGRIRALLRKLNAEHREGLVFKDDPKGARRTKYVTSNANVSDIRSTAENILELPPNYFTNRILRLALGLQEQGLERSRELEQRLGAAFLEGLLEALDQYNTEQRVYHSYRCRFRQRQSALDFLTFLQALGGNRAKIEQRDLRQESGYWVLEYLRGYPALNGLLGSVLRGGVLYD
jgi:putative ATP-dependent DNA ligase